MKYLEFPNGMKVILKEIPEAEMRDLMARGVNGIPAFYATVDGVLVYCPPVPPNMKVVDE